MTRSGLLAPLVVLSALVAVPAAAQAVDGSYRLLRVNGNSLPAWSHTNDGTRVRGGAVVFDTDGRFTLSLATRTEEGRESREDAAGTYVLDVDSLWFTPAAPLGGLSAFRWDRDGDTLRLLSGAVGEYLFVREPSAATGDAWAPGRYELTHLNGDALPAPVPRTGGVVVHALTFEFTQDGRWTWIVQETSGSQPMTPQNDGGRYTVARDKLVLMRNGKPNEFFWTLRNGTLRLVDDEGVLLVLTRR